MANVTAGAGHPFDMSVAHSYALTNKNFFTFEVVNLFGPPVPVYFHTSGGIVDVGATLFFFFDFPDPITHISVYATLTPDTGDLLYSVSGAVLPTQTIISGFFSVGKLVTVNFAALLSGDDTITGSFGDDKLFGFGGADSISGLSGNDLIFGGAGNDLVNGGDGNDTLNGGLGADTMIGGPDDDTYIVDNVGDTVNENPGEGTDRVLSSVSFVLGTNVENLILTGTVNINGTGNELNNKLIGNTGNNRLDGMGSADTMTGGAGNDTYAVDDPDDTINDIAGIDTVESSVTYSLGPTLEKLTLTGSADINGTGNALANTLTGNSGNNTLSGLAGNDTLNGGAGDDGLNGGDGNDVILIGNAAEHGVDEVITGGAGVDVIRFTSITADDILVLNATVTGVESVVIGTAAGLTTGTTALNVDASNIATGLTLTGNAGANVLTGTSANDVLKGGGGGDTLDGGSGNNMLIGGTGNDSYFVDSSTDVVSEGLAAGTDKVFASLTYTLGANLENLELTGSDPLNGTGNTLANIITGNSGNNTLSGLAGADTLNGGAGDDAMNGGAGNDQLIGGAGQDTVTGGAGNDQITMLVTSGNVDAIDAGTGNDTLLLSGSGDVVMDLSSLIDQVAMSDGVGELLVQKNFENLDASGLGSSVNATGSAGANIIIGSNGDDIINGGAGNDVLNGRAGDDTLNGGDGNDAILIGNAADHGVGEVITGGAGADVIRFTSTADGDGLVLRAQVTGVESVVIGNAAGLTTGTTKLDVNAISVGYGLSLTGNAGDNQLVGTDFNDVLNGGGGDDSLYGGLGINTLIGGTGVDLLVGSGGTNTLIGGAGNDTYVVDSSTDVVIEALNAGTDLVLSSMETYTLGLNVENLILVGNNTQNGTGNALNNIIDGNDSSNQLSGLAGADTLHGFAGDDLILLASTAEFAAGEIVDGGDDTDTLRLTSTVAGTLTLTNLVTSIEQVELATAAGDPMGIAAINVNAAAVTNGLGITGNAGNNVLTGTGQADTLTGNGGNDTLTGGAGDDTLLGGDGNDVILIGSAADHGVGEVIDGGAGADVIRFTSTSAGGTLIVALGVTTVESVVIGTAAGVTTSSTALNVDASAVGSGLLLTGNNGANQITGTAFADTLTGKAGNDILTGGDGNDTFTGGAGADTLHGFAGDDLILLAFTAEFAAGEIVDGGDDTDTMRYTGTAAGTLTLTANVTNIEQVEIANAAGSSVGTAAINVNAAAVANGLTIVGNNGANVLTGTAQTDTLTGNGGNDTLNGGASDDTLSGGAGVDTLRGGLGNDTYQVNRGDGQDTISENDSTPSNSDTLLYGATINPLDLVLSRQANDLRLAIHGSTERMTIQNWFSTPDTAQVETIQAGNGQTLLSTQVDQLIQAMASFTTTTGLSWDAAIDGGGTPQQQTQFQGILAASWQ